MARLTFLMIVVVGVCLLGADHATATATVQGFPGQNTRPYESSWAEQGRKATQRMAEANKKRAARQAEQRQKRTAAAEQNAKKAASEAAAKAKAEAEQDAKRAASEAAAKAKAEAAAKAKAEAAAKAKAEAEQDAKRAASEGAAKAKSEPKPVPTPTPVSPSPASEKNAAELVYVSKDGRLHEATDIHKTVEEKISDQLEEVEKSIKELKATSEDYNRRLDDLESQQKVTEERQEPNAMSPQVDKIKTSLDKVKIAAGDISSKLKDSFSNIKDKIKAAEKNEEVSQQKEAEKEEKEKENEEIRSKSAQTTKKDIPKSVSDRIQDFGRFMQGLSSSCDSAIKACQADKHGCNTLLSCIDVKFETSREAAVNCFDTARCEAAADSTGNRVSTEIKDLYYNCVNKPCENCKDEEQSMLEHAVVQSTESTEADEIAKYKSYLSALSDQLMSKITGCFKCSKPAAWEGLFYVSNERQLLGVLDQKPSDLHDLKKHAVGPGTSAAATTSEGQSSPKDKCAVLPTSMNGAKFGKGCGSAVWFSGSPSKQYCTGDNGRFPWWAECCEWTGAKCEAKSATKSNSAVVNAAKQKISSMAKSWAKKIKSFGFRFLEQRSRTNLRVTEECS